MKRLIATALALLAGCAVMPPGANVDERYRVASINHAFGAALALHGGLALVGTGVGYGFAESRGGVSAADAGPFVIGAFVGAALLGAGVVLINAGDDGFQSERSTGAR